MDTCSVMTERAPAPGGAYSHAWVVGDLVFTAGQVGIDPASGTLVDGLAAQVKQAIKNLEAVLEATGARLDTVLKTTCFLADIAGFAEFDAAYRAAFAEPYPARSTFGVDLASGLKFEIEAVAVRGKSEA